MSGYLLTNVTRRKWKYASLFNSDIDEIVLGSISCTVMYEADCNTLVAVINRNPGNGDFHRLLDYLEAEASAKGRQFRVEPIWNKELRKHLINKCNYQASGDDGVVKQFSVGG